LFALCVVLIFLQNGLGVGLANVLGINKNIGLLGGSISLAGGLGTSIAWGETLSKQYGLANATEIGIACATLGLILGGISGGPIGEFLIRRHGLKPEGRDGVAHIEVKHGDEVPVSQDSFLYTLLIIGLSVGLGMYLNSFVQQTSFRLPAYVSCMFCGILLSNTVPALLPRLDWPTKHASLDLIMEISLGLFLSITLMSLQLINLVAAAIPILIIVAAQWLMAVLFIVLAIFPAMRKNYNSAVISAGAAGFMLGATPNAIANMHAVTGKYGPSHYAFIIVPLVGGFLLDLVNALVIELFLVI
jgi:ESS family glutamate:Na+ symporter